MFKTAEERAEEKKKREGQTEDNFTNCFIKNFNDLINENELRGMFAVSKLIRKLKFCKLKKYYFYIWFDIINVIMMKKIIIKLKK